MTSNRRATGRTDCRACFHPDVDNINAMIKSGVHSYAEIARVFGLVEDGISRHARAHLGMESKTSGPLCYCCASAHLEDINAALRAGSDYAAIAREFGVPWSSARNHKARHMDIPLRPRLCPVCSHPELALIEASLVMGATNKTTANRFGLSEGSLKRHRQKHMGARGVSKTYKCIVCTHDQVDAINSDLLDGKIYRHVALRYGLSISSVQHHNKLHLETIVQQGRERLHAEMIEVTEAHLLATSKAKQVMTFAQAKRDTAVKPKPVVLTALAIAERHMAEAAKEVAAARATLQSATSKYLAAKVALQDAHRRETELAHLTYRQEQAGG